MADAYEELLDEHARTVHRLKCRIITLEAVLRDLLEYTDSEFAGDGMPDSKEQARARVVLQSSDTGAGKVEPR